MNEEFEQNLLTFKRKTITIDELEKLIPATITYEEFSALILQLEQEYVLQIIKSKGRNQRTPSLAYHYRINKHQLNRAYHQQLQAYRLKFNDAIDLDAYFHLNHTTWVADLPYLEKVNTYIEKNGFPIENIPAPERSYELVYDEKWIEQKGSEVLKRINLWNTMKILPVSDPLMLAINPNTITEENHLHIIVENKTTYQALLPVLPSSSFSTLIYGSGNKIPKSIENFSNQYPVEGNHRFFYFGDIDQSGITIWHSLHRREPATPALPFYQACLHKTGAHGKTNQRPNDKALTAFLDHFPKKQRHIILDLLDRGAYYPQEVLKTKELQTICLETDWRHVKA
ncbi:hypothetical protein CIL05_03345 [Virgibacillus profundi]|uniref:Wadjet protein JetD C-terminal domain-containing protein n=2 Tax=Virgibacillus profundi TaxID=2024555 RepID=A0A2A2IFJ8_9BACI|nr:hypothetical protein CIL05_03345 [Virgibacillus profundi]PXY54954.1 hypothetical protein CIT14_03425 [Virgibacillus profundi]